MIEVEDIHIGSCVRIARGDLIELAGPGFVDAIDPRGALDMISVSVVDIMDERCIIVPFAVLPELTSANVNLSRLAMLSISVCLEKLPVEKTEQVSHPSHYAWLKDLCGVEPLDICRHLDFNTGNAIKYLLRKDKVDGNKTKTEKRIEDLRKAVFYIQDEVNMLEHSK